MQLLDERCIRVLFEVAIRFLYRRADPTGLCRPIGFLSATHLAACRSRIAAGAQPRLPEVVGARVRYSVGGLGRGLGNGRLGGGTRSESPRVPGLPSVAVRGAGTHRALVPVSC